VGTKIFKNLLAILLLTALTAPWLAVTVAAKPLGPNPGWTHWPAGTIWGAGLYMENNTSGDVFFGAKTGAEHTYPAAIPGFPPYIWMVFRQGATDYSEITRTESAAPQSYTWYVKMLYNNSGTGDNVTAKIWAELENADTAFIPQNYSVILENQAKGIGPWNLRKENGSINLVDGVTKYATLYVDNAVNIQNIDNLDPLNGKPGDNLHLKVTVKNTGRYTDNYVVSAGGSLDPTILNLAPGNTDNVIVTTTLPNGTENIAITAAGNYATDQGYVTATGILMRKVKVEITPNENFGENGETLTFDVLVKNIGDFLDNYELTVENIWEAFISPTQLDNLNPGENMHATLFVKIPDNANPGDSDNVTVTATSMENVEVSDNATCMARMGSYSVEVSIIPGYQDNAPGGTLNYTIIVSNTGTLNDSYNLTFSDNIDGSAYWENSISLDNSLLAVPSGENRTTTLRVAIPDNAPPGTDDNITATATSQADNTVENSASCIAHVARLSVSISPGYQSGLPGTALSYFVDITNNENTEVDYYSVVTDIFGWKLAFGIKEIILYPFGWVRTILKVTIPENAIGDTGDTVTVTMVSIDNTTRDSGSCIARVTVVRGVEISIVPYEREGPPGVTLEYTIMVKNTGNVEDNYDLTADDNVGWGLAILPPSLTVPPRNSENATLSVMIPENAEPLITDNITVTGKSQANPSISAENTCTAFSLATFKENLVNGWNLVSFPVAWENDTPANLFAGHTYYIWRWDPIMQKYVNPPSDQPVEVGVGYWIWVDNNKTVTTSGIPVENYLINLVAGWNLVGFPVTSDNTTPANLFDGQVYYIWRWDAIMRKYTSQWPNQPVELGVGYWIYVNTPTSITVPL